MTDEVMSTFPLLALWEAQTDKQGDDFTLIVETIDPRTLIEGLLFTTSYLCHKWTPDPASAFINFVDTGRACVRIAATWEEAGGVLPEVRQSIHEVGMALVMAPVMQPDGSIIVNLQVPVRNPYAMATAVCAPLNVLRKSALEKGFHPDEDSFIGWLRGEFWRVQAENPQ